MQVKALWCPTEQAVVSRDHYEKEECLALPAPPAWLAATLAAIEGDKIHSGNRFTASRLSGCPREAAIADNIPVTVNLLDFNSIMWGNAMHEFLAKWASGHLREVRFPLEGQEPVRLFKGTPFEIEITGGVDYLAPSLDALKDYKAHGASQQRFKYEDSTKGLVDEGWQVQFSVYKILAEQCIEGADIRTMSAWNGAMVGKRDSAPPWFESDVPALSEQEILALRPLNGRFTIADHIAFSKEFHERISKVDRSDQAAVEAAVNTVPLAGRDMGWRGKKGGFTSKCEYCSVRRDCDRLAGTASL